MIRWRLREALRCRMGEIAALHDLRQPILSGDDKVVAE